MSGGAAKRVVDVVLGAVVVLFAVPVILLLALGVCISFRTVRPFFLQKRIGQKGKPFTIVKLRTLPLNAPPAAGKYTIARVDTTRFGRLLRTSHLDELPQLFLVLLGRMSLVGPRPEMPNLLASFDPSFVAARSRVRPGCTGFWQISVDAGRLIGETPEYDLYYVKHAGVRLDAWVLWKSLLFVLSGRAVAFADVPMWARRRREVPLELTGVTSLNGLSSDLAPELAPETMPASG